MPKKIDTETALCLILIYIILIVMSFFSSVGLFVYGYGLEVKSWASLVFFTMLSAAILAVIKTLNKLFEE